METSCFLYNAEHGDVPSRFGGVFKGRISLFPSNQFTRIIQQISVYDILYFAVDGAVWDIQLMTGV